MNRLTLILLTVTLLGCVTTGSPPRPTTSDYFITRGGGFALRLNDKKAVQSCRYSLLLTLRRPITTPMYLRTRFENPADPASPLLLDSELQPGVGEVHISSLEVRGLEPRRSYKVEVLIFDSPERSRQVGQHVQYVQSSFAQR